jgi:hypothetical protein
MIKTRRLAVPGFFGWGRKTYNYFERLFERLSELFCDEEEERLRLSCPWLRGLFWLLPEEEWLLERCMIILLLG